MSNTRKYTARAEIIRRINGQISAVKPGSQLDLTQEDARQLGSAVEAYHAVFEADFAVVEDDQGSDDQGSDDQGSDDQGSEKPKTRAELIKEATEKGLTFKANITREKLLELLAQSSPADEEEELV